MKKIKQESIKITAGAIALASLASDFIRDKLGDLVISVFSEGNITPKKFMYSILLLFLVLMVTVGIQSGWSIVKILKRRMTGETRIEELQRRISETRSEIFHNLRNLRYTKQSFENTVDSAQRDVLSLVPNDIDFNSRKRLVAQNVLGLKEIYQKNISDLERLVDKAYRDMDDAERVFSEAESWANQAADEFFR